MAKKPRRGRPPIEERILVRVPKGTLRQVKAALEDGEKQADFARTAFANELERRKTRQRD
jgi:hypothetical protein